MLDNTYPKSDDAMVYDFTKHRYILTPQYVLNNLGIDLYEKMGGARTVNTTTAINVLLDNRISFKIYSAIYAHQDKQLMEYILAKFINTPDNQSQLLVSTHYDPILKDIDDIFGKDSVWFTEKGKDGNTALFSLTDFKGLNKLSSIHRAYMNGQFGALPNVL